jgi:hypothetical protein
MLLWSVVATMVNLSTSRIVLAGRRVSLFPSAPVEWIETVSYDGLWCCNSGIGNSRFARDGVLSIFPFLAADRTRILARRLTQPLAYALEMEGMAAFTPHHGTIFAGVFDSGTHSLKSRLTNPTHVVVGVPAPRRHGVEPLKAHFQSNFRDHGGRGGGQGGGVIVFIAGNHHRLARSFLAAGHARVAGTDRQAHQQSEEGYAAATATIHQFHPLVVCRPSILRSTHTAAVSCTSGYCASDH